MKLFRRRETLNEQLLRQGEIGSQRKQTAVTVDRKSVLDERSSEPTANAALSDVLGEVDFGGFGQGQPWDAFVIAKAPGLDCDEVLFWALPGGDLLVAEKGVANISALADAVEKKVQRPYKALAGRQDSVRWAVAARRIAVAHFAFSGGDSLELARDDAAASFIVDGKPSDLPIPKELEAAGDSESRDFYVLAERIDGDLWDLRATSQ